MSKKHMNMKYILSVMLAIVLAFAPMTSLKAMADEEEPEQNNPVTVDTTEYYSVSATIVTDAGEENHVIYQGNQSFKMLKDNTILNEAEYNAEHQRVAGLLDAWVNENGYSGVGEQNVRSESGDRVVTYYLNDGTEVDEMDWDPDIGYTVTTQNVYFFWTYYYDARNNEDPGQEPQVNYTYKADPLNYTIGSEALLDDQLQPIGKMYVSAPVDSIIGIKVGDVSKTEYSVTYDEYGATVNFPVAFFSGFEAGTYDLSIIFSGDTPDTLTEMNVHASPLSNYDYKCLVGDGTEYIIGSQMPITFIFNVPCLQGESQIERVDSIALNSTDSIPAGNFMAGPSMYGEMGENRLRIRIFPEYLEKLYESGDGEIQQYRIEPHFMGGDRYSNATFTIRMPYTYEVLEGDEQKYDPTAGSDVVIKIDGPDAEVVSVVVDDVTLDADDYTIEHGSTVLTLKDDYLKTLAAGEHQITVNYNGDKVANATITVKEATNQGSGENQGEDGSTGGNTEGGSQGGSQGGNTEGGNTEGGNTGNTQPAEKPEDGENTGKENGTTQNETEKESGSDKNSGKEITSGNKENNTDKNTEKKPNTGDNGVTVALALFMMSMVGICAAMYARKKTVREN